MGPPTQNIIESEGCNYGRMSSHGSKEDCGHFLCMDMATRRKGSESPWSWVPLFWQVFCCVWFTLDHRTSGVSLWGRSQRDVSGLRAFTHLFYLYIFHSTYLLVWLQSRVKAKLILVWVVLPVDCQACDRFQVCFRSISHPGCLVETWLRSIFEPGLWERKFLKVKIIDNLIN